MMKKVLFVGTAEEVQGRLAQEIAAGRIVSGTTPEEGELAAAQIALMYEQMKADAAPAPRRVPPSAPKRGTLDIQRKFEKKGRHRFYVVRIMDGVKIVKEKRFKAEPDGDSHSYAFWQACLRQAMNNPDFRGIVESSEDKDSPIEIADLKGENE